MTNVSDLGECGLIERLKGVLGKPTGDDLIVGIGDDAAVWRIGDEFVIATTDSMVEGVHFEVGRAPWADIGWKALATNVSDIGAMGGTPLFALVTLAIPPTMAADDVELIYAGLSECAREYGVTIVGGDSVRAPQITITVALIGLATQQHPALVGRRQERRLYLLRRDAAKPGDVIVVTGTLGDSAGGLRRIQEGAGSDDPLVRRHLWPRPPLVAGNVAAVSGVECGIDISDGLLKDVGHICERSHVGAIIHATDIPISAELRALYDDDALRLACTGGEDYELLLTMDRRMYDVLTALIDFASPTVIGEIVDDDEYRVRLLNDAGKEITFDRPGWDAFR